MPDPITATIAGSTLIGAGGSIYAAHEQSEAAGRASKRQAQAQREAAQKRLQAAREEMNLKRNILNRQATAQQPFENIGYNVMPQLQAQVTGQVPDIQDPGAAARQARQQGPSLAPLEKKELEALQDKMDSGPITDEEIDRLHELQGKKQRFEKQRQTAAQEARQQQSQLQQGAQMADPDESAIEMMGPEQAGLYEQMRTQTEQPLEESPYYQWRSDETEEAISQAMAARGMQRSTPAVEMIGDQQRALTGEMTQNRYNRLGQMYNMAQGVRQNQFNQLAQLANIGQGGAAQTQQALGQYAQGAGGALRSGATGAANAMARAGQARAQGIRQQGNIRGNMISQLGAMPMRGLQTYMMGKASGVFGGNSGTQAQPYMFPNNRLTTGSRVLK